ncbi:hypothetical protein [Nonomuraea indica]|uniref:Uncharacterized protein n=1 Tax=Nonomuraea indica TaxID=1581193 RepID=A0ABW8A1Y2_9ACTN
MVNTLSLARRLRPHEQLGKGVFRSECSFLDFEIDGDSLLDLVAQRSPGNGDMASVLWLSAGSELGLEVDRLQGRAASSLDDGRIPLYVCPECGDLGCGALTAVVAITSDQVVWRDLGWQVDYRDEVDLEDLDGIGPFVFQRAQYEAAFAGVPVPDAYQQAAQQQGQPRPWWMRWRR